MRSAVQAQICNSSDGRPVDISRDFPAKPATKSVGSFSAPAGAEVKTSPPKAKKPDLIILEVLREGGTMIVADCEHYCAERGVDEETFKKIFQKLIEAGLIYRPDKGLAALVP